MMVLASMNINLRNIIWKVALNESTSSTNMVVCVVVEYNHNIMSIWVVWFAYVVIVSITAKQEQQARNDVR